MIQDTACIYFSEDALNKLIGKFDDEQEHPIYKMAREARLNIFRY